MSICMQGLNMTEVTYLKISDNCTIDLFPFALVIFTGVMCTALFVLSGGLDLFRKKQDGEKK